MFWRQHVARLYQGTSRGSSDSAHTAKQLGKTWLPLASWRAYASWANATASDASTEAPSSRLSECACPDPQSKDQPVKGSKGRSRAATHPPDGIEGAREVRLHEAVVEAHEPRDLRVSVVAITLGSLRNARSRTLPSPPAPRGDDEENHVEWAALGFIYAIGVLSFAGARPRGVSGIPFEEYDQCACTGPSQAFGLSLQVRGQPRRVGLFIPLGLAHEERRTVLALGHNVDLERPAVLTAPRTRARFRPRSKDGCKPFEHPEDCQRADGVRWNEVGVFGQGNGNPRSPALTSRVTATK